MSDFRFTFNRKEKKLRNLYIKQLQKKEQQKDAFLNEDTFFRTHMYTRYSVKNIIVTKPEHSFIFCKSSFHFPSVTFLLILSSKNLA